VRANPIGVRTTPEQAPTRTNAKKDPNADGAEPSGLSHGRDPGETAMSRL